MSFSITGHQQLADKTFLPLRCYPRRRVTRTATPYFQIHPHTSRATPHLPPGQYTDSVTAAGCANASAKHSQLLQQAVCDFAFTAFASNRIGIPAPAPVPVPNDNPAPAPAPAARPSVRMDRQSSVRAGRSTNSVLKLFETALNLLTHLLAMCQMPHSHRSPPAPMFPRELGRWPRRKLRLRRLQHF